MGVAFVQINGKTEKEEKNRNFFKKGIDKREKKWYNIQAAQESNQARRRSLKIEQQEMSTKQGFERSKPCVKQISQFLKRILLKQKVKRANKSSKKDWMPQGFWYKFFESLILAQDERWRRA